VGIRQGQPALIAVEGQGEQQLLTTMFGMKLSEETQAIQDMKRYGYWLSESFLPGCFVQPKAQQTLHHWFGTVQEQHQTDVTFQGIIATGRILRRDGLVTLLTIGVENKRYIDLIYADHDRSDLFKWSAVAGKGRYEKRGLVETIHVDSIKGVSLESLLAA
jgi:hypothetical protein